MPRGKPHNLSDWVQKGILAADESGWTIRAISDYFGLPRSTIHDFLRRPPERRTEDFELVFPINGLMPGSQPTHIRDGDPAVCMVSHQTGDEENPKFRPDRPKKKPESKSKFEPHAKKRKSQSLSPEEIREIKSKYEPRNKKKTKRA